MPKVSPIGRVSYPHVFKPQEYQGKSKYSLSLLFDDTADLSAMKAEAERVAKEKWPKGLPKGFKSPFRDGEEKEQPEYEGMTFVNFRANEDRKPAVVDAAKRPIAADSGEFYAGCYARVSFSCFAYDVSGSKGVAFGLNNVQKVRDGDRLDGSTTADDDFDALEEESSSDLF